MKKQKHGKLFSNNQPIIKNLPAQNVFINTLNSVVSLPQIQFSVFFALHSFLLETLPTYTKSQLALRNGSDKPEIWIAYKGLIYDVTESRLWRNGKHYEHWAGQDLTPELLDAPHTEKVFERFVPIGQLV